MFDGSSVSVLEGSTEGFVLFAPKRDFSQVNILACDTGSSWLVKYVVW